MNVDIQHFFAQIMRNRRGPQNMQGLEGLKQIVSQISAKISERAVGFVKTLFEAQNIRSIQLLDWTYSIPNPSQSPLCSKVMGGQKGGGSFRCFECMQSTSSCICAQCFEKGDHKGHNYVQYNSVNGCCDCGNSEAWNEKGFCSTHLSISSSKCEIPPSTRSLYIEEGQFLLYIYLYIYDNVPSRKGLLEQYGSQVFKHLTKVSQENYEMKLLAGELMESKFDEKYPSVPLRKHSIIEIFFRLQSERAKAFNELVNWIFETFPVESMRRKIIKEYFQKMRRQDQIMTTDTPLGGLNFQYMSSVKEICKMIKQKEIQPFQAPYIKLNQLDSQQLMMIPLMFKKIYEDIDYITNMKSCKQYHILQFQVGSIAQMAAYRQVSKNQQPLPFDRNLAPIFNVDQMFLKSLYKFVRSVKDEKQILGKCLAQLFHYIFNAGENLSSMAQERAFAMLTMAYFDGSLDPLFEQDKRDNFIKLLGIQKNQFQYMLEAIAKATLHSTFNYLALSEPPRTAYETYFLKSNMEKMIPQYLDKIFWKILILLSRNIFPFDQMMLAYFRSRQQKIQREQMDIQDKQEKFKRSLQFGSLIMIAMNQAASTARFDIDQTIISTLLGFLNKQKLFELFSKVVATYKQSNPKELKISCLEIANNEELFQQFVTKYIIIDKGRFKLKQEVKPFQYLVYHGIFRGYSRPMPQTQVTYLNGQQQYPRFRQVRIYSPELISLAIEKCMEFISILADERNPQVEALLNSMVREIFILYLLDRKDQYRYFFRALLNPSLRIFFSKILIEQITMVQKEQEELAKDLQKIKTEQAEQFKAKREKIMQKKKMKEQMMRKNQEKMLSKFTKQVQQMKAQQQTGEICIYCKEENNQQLSLISYVGLTNLIEKNILKHNLFHYFFSSCGHRIHLSCFIKANEKQSRNFCFLCKQQANILLPQLGNTESKIENSKQKADEFVSSILTALVDEHEINDGKIGQFDNSIFEENIEILLTSIAKQLTYNGLHDYTFFKKKLYCVYLHLFEILRLISKENVLNAFEKMKIKWDKDQHEKHKLQYIQRAFQLKMQQHFLNTQTQFSIQQLKLSQPELEQITKLFNIIINRTPETEISELKQINPDTLFIKIPSTLNELHQYMGNCKNCNNLTNNIFLCMVCGWSACIKCVKEIFKHVVDEHIDGSIILGCSTGTIKYFKGRGIFEDISIYENYLGLSFSDAETYSQFGKSEKYNLNHEKEKELRKMLLHYQVHQKVQLNSDIRVNYM